MAWQPALGAQQPAYTAVPARTTLVRPMPVVCSSQCAPDWSSGSDASVQPAPIQAEKPKKVEWSEPVKAYVRRAFDPDNAIPGITHQELQEKLKSIISYFAERQMQDQMDWSTYPLPQNLIREERQRQAAAMQLASDVDPSSLPANSYSALSPRSKRKSQDEEELRAATSGSIPPWQKSSLEDRVTYGNGNKRQKKNSLTKDIISKFDQADLEKRKQRFQLGKSGSSAAPWDSSRPDSDSDTDTGPIVGTNQSLEKSYFRLTAPPKPETVRPQHVLEKTLDLLRKKWREEKNYNYICNQFKSLRQDLTVQHIKNAFTVRVYEIHARIALEKGDLGEYNQCQTQLKALYLQGLGGHPGEFLAYRILYFVYTCNKTDMNDLLAELTPADKAQDAVKHALDVRSALALGNYHKFFRLYLQAPNMGAYMMDMFIERERLNALANISRA